MLVATGLAAMIPQEYALEMILISVGGLKDVQRTLVTGVVIVA